MNLRLALGLYLPALEIVGKDDMWLESLQNFLLGYSVQKESLPETDIPGSERVNDPFEFLVLLVGDQRGTKRFLVTSCLCLKGCQPPG